MNFFKGFWQYFIGDEEAMLTAKKAKLAQNKGAFDKVVITSISRFGRNTRDSLNNIHTLKEAGVEVFFIDEGLHTDDPNGQLVLTMMAAIAENGAKIIGETSIRSKMSLAARNIPAVGNLPFGRTFDKKTGKWGLLPEIKEDMERCAREYLKGRSLNEIADELCARGYKAKYSTIVKVFKHVARDTWKVKFKDEDEPVIFTVPALLDDKLIKRVKDRMEKRRKRPSIKKSSHQYLLRQLAYCEECGCLLWAASNNKKPYYEHPRGSNSLCSQKGMRVFTTHLDNAVLRTVWENIYDKDAFDAAIRASMPNEDEVKRLTASIKQCEKGITSIAKKKSNLIDAVANEVFTHDDIKGKMQTLNSQEVLVQQDITANHKQLEMIGSAVDIKQDAQLIRRQYMQYFGSQGRLAEMTFAEKRQLIEVFFEGTDISGNTHGIYLADLSKKHSRQRRYDYTVYSNVVFGSRTMAGWDYNAAPIDKELQGWSRSYEAPTNNAAVAARGKHLSLDMAAIDRNYGRSRKPKNRVVANTWSSLREQRCPSAAEFFIGMVQRR